MTRAPFRLGRGGAIEASLTDTEVDLLHRVAEQVGQAAREPDAPASTRLYPPGYHDDAAAAAEFRRLTHDDLTGAKIRAAETVARSLDSGRRKRSGEWRGLLDEESSAAWLSVLNDARLVLGTTLEVSEDMDHSPLPADDPRAPSLNLYLYLSALEEALIDALSARDLPADRAGGEPWD